MITLGIETSCDETALCLLETRNEIDGLEYRILGNIVHSQIDIHREYGGVFPMLAKREHTKNLPILYKKIIDDSGVVESKIDNISVTQGPGLEPALWTGILFAKDLGKKLNIPVIPINHMEGHIVSTLILGSSTHNEFKKLKVIEFPAIALLISGGHTEIVKIDEIDNKIDKKNWKYKILGKTVDDAVGEAFDKVARMLSLPYPGGPEISRLAEEARARNLPNKIKLPRPMIHSKDLNFSFSGLKTAVLYTLKKLGKITDNEKGDIAREFENSVTEVLISKARTTIEENETRILIVGGGVIANKHIKEEFEKLAKEYSVNFYSPVSGLSGDNALMIALVGAIKPSSVNFDEGFRALGNLSLG